MSEHVPDPPVRPPGTCVTCPPPKGNAWVRADPRHVTCSDCYDRIRARLAEVAERYLLLDPRPGGGAGGDGGRYAPGFGSRSPGSDHIIVMRDPRSSQVARTWVGKDGRVHQEPTRPPMSVHGALSGLSWSIAEHRGVSGPGDRDDVFALLRFIDRHMDYITRHTELTVDLDDTTRDLVGALRPLTGDARRRIGKCPQMVVRRPAEESGENEPAEPERCNATLYAPLNDDVIVCHVCGHAWNMDEWLTLGDALTPVDIPA